MPIDLAAASRFMTTHARLLDRRRFDLLFGGGGAGDVLDALGAYRNADGGYGWGIEPDLRAPESQPAGALHAFEVLEEAGPVTEPRAGELCDWLESATLDDGGLPFALPVASAAGTAPFWAGADPHASSLHITAAVAEVAQRVARHDPGVAGHPWLARATRYCLDAIAAADWPGHAYVLMYAVRFLDTAAAFEPEAVDLLDRVAAAVPDSGAMHVEGGADDEYLRALDYAPAPDSRVRGRLAEGVAAAELDRLSAGQREDGGWTVGYASYSPAAALEWRGYRTVEALKLLSENGRALDFKQS